MEVPRSLEPALPTCTCNFLLVSDVPSIPVPSGTLLGSVGSIFPKWLYFALRRPTIREIRPADLFFTLRERAFYSDPPSWSVAELSRLGNEFSSQCPARKHRRTFLRATPLPLCSLCCFVMLLRYAPRDCHPTPSILNTSNAAPHGLQLTSCGMPSHECCTVLPGLQPYVRRGDLRDRGSADNFTHHLSYLVFIRMAGVRLWLE